MKIYIVGKLAVCTHYLNIHFSLAELKVLSEPVTYLMTISQAYLQVIYTQHLKFTLWAKIVKPDTSSQEGMSGDSGELKSQTHTPSEGCTQDSILYDVAVRKHEQIHGCQIFRFSKISLVSNFNMKFLKSWQQILAFLKKFRGQINISTIIL